MEGGGRNNWRPRLERDPAMIVSDVVGPNNVWRSQLSLQARYLIVSKIVDTLKWRLPISHDFPEGLRELNKIAVKFEEKMYDAATSQSDYLRKISIKMLAMEKKNLEANGSNPGPTNSNIASQSPPDAGTAIEEPVTILTLSNHHVARIMPGSHVFISDSYEDVESNHRIKRMKVGSSRDPQMEIYLEPEEPAQLAFRCVVCLGPLVDETSTICGHIFCQSCIKTAIKAQKRCPTCRKKLNMRNIHRVYFPGSS